MYFLYGLKFGKTCLKRPLKTKTKNGGGGGGVGGGVKINYRFMLVKSIAECSCSNTFDPQLHKIFVLSIFEWPLKTGFTVAVYLCIAKFLVCFSNVASVTFII